jgi:thiamine pyrophosphate-dependent acetolactate synthase large subunit-like protein
VCLRTLGPGALNLATGAAYAHLGAMPMILVTGQKAIRSSQQARFQIIDMCSDANKGIEILPLGHQLAVSQAAARGDS